MSQLGTIDCYALYTLRHTFNADERSVMVSRVYFTLTLADATQQPISLFVDITQPYGTDFEDEPVEVSRPYRRAPSERPEALLTGPYQPTPYNGAFNHSMFADGMDHYCRLVVGKDGQAIRINPQARDAHIIGSRFDHHYQFVIVMDEVSPANPW